MINSHLLYQLSYRGIHRMLLIKKDKSSTTWHCRTQSDNPFGFYPAWAISLARSSQARAAGGR